MNNKQRRGNQPRDTTRVWRNPLFTQPDSKSLGKQQADALFDNSSHGDEEKEITKPTRKTHLSWGVLSSEEQKFLANMIRRRAMNMGETVIIITLASIGGEARINVQGVRKGREYHEPLVPAEELPIQQPPEPTAPSPKRYKARLDFGIYVKMPDGTQEVLDWIR